MSAPVLTAQLAELLERLANGVVKRGAYLANQLAFPVRPGAVGEQHNGNRSIEIDP
jgi:hypothetical protein